MGPIGDPVADAAIIIAELEQFDADLAARERWLVLNKTDLLPAEERTQRCQDVVRALDWSGPVFEIAALTNAGTGVLVHAVMDFIERQKAMEDYAEDG